MALLPKGLGSPSSNSRPTLFSLIKNEEFKAAEEIIEATRDLTLLDDGSLHLVLGCRSMLFIKNLHHLRLARLLVQKGASIIGMIWNWHDNSDCDPFEDLVVYYEMLKCFIAGNSNIFNEVGVFLDSDEEKLKFLTNAVDLNDRKCLPDMENCKKLLEDTRELIDIFLDNGSNPNVRMMYGGTLFHWILEKGDIELANRFLRTCRVNVNDTDYHGNSPFMDGILRNTPEDSLNIYEPMLDLCDLNINLTNCIGESALFRAMFVGATELATRLCKDGAALECDISLQGLSFYEEMGEISIKTPYLAPLLRDSLVRLRYIRVSTSTKPFFIMNVNKYLTDKIISSALSPLMDNGCFNKEIVALDVISLLDLADFPFLENEDISPTYLLQLMFGQISAGLRQLCVRIIFDHFLMVFLVARKPVFKDISVFRSPPNKKPIFKCNIKEWMEYLGIPSKFALFFEIEAAKYQISNYFQQFQTIECQRSCNNSGNNTNESNNSIESNDNDSDTKPSSLLSYADTEFNFSLSDRSISSSESDSRSIQEDIDEKDEMKEAEGTNPEIPLSRNKITYEEESSGSSSLKRTDIEDGDTSDESVGPPNKYQKLSDESTSTSISPGNLTESEYISDSPD